MTPTEAKTWRKLLRKALDLFSLPPPMRVSEWADEYRFLSGESSAKPGKWVSLPFQREMMDAALDPHVSTVVLMLASQTTGKTEIINNIIGYFIDRDPCPILLLQPNVEAGEGWSKERFVPMVRDTPILQGKIKEAKSRDTNSRILHKVFPGGHLSIVGANAPAGLAMRPIRVVLCDEVDRYPKSAGIEGDPVSLASKRSESFPDAIKFMVSTPTVKGLSRITAEFNETDKRYYFVPCPFCGHMQTLVWKQVKWPKGQPENALYHCEECEHGWTDEQRIAAVRDKRAHWQATDPEKHNRGYHMNGIYCLFKPHKDYKTRLHEFAAKFLEANGKGEDSRKAWTNTFLAEPWEQKSEEPPDPIELMLRCEDYQILPAGALVLTCMADLQANRLEYEIVAHGQGDESWGIQYERLYGHPELEPIWDTFLERLQQRFDHPCGKQLKIETVCIDCGHLPHRVRTFVRRCWRQGIRAFATLGSRTRWDPYTIREPKTMRQHRHFQIGTDHVKVLLSERLKIKTPGPRYCHFPIGRGYDEKYFQQLAAERLVLHFENDILIDREWVKQQDRNEALDIRVGIIAGLAILKPNYAALAEKLAIKAESEISKANEGQEQAEPKQTSPDPSFVSRGIPRRRFGRGGGGFVGRW